MIDLSKAKKIRRDICTSLGHEYVPVIRKYGLKTETWDVCSRCKSSEMVFSTQRVVMDTFPVTDSPKVKWADLYTKKFNVLDRAKERINKPEEL